MSFFIANFTAYDYSSMLRFKINYISYRDPRDMMFHGLCSTDVITG